METFSLEAQLIAIKVIIYIIEKAFQSSTHSISSAKKNAQKLGQLKSFSLIYPMNVAVTKRSSATAPGTAWLSRVLTPNFLLARMKNKTEIGKCSPKFLLTNAINSKGIACEASDPVRRAFLAAFWPLAVNWSKCREDMNMGTLATQARQGYK